MRLVIAVSGPIAVGKSACLEELERRFRAVRISTRALIQSLRSVPSERRPLQEAGSDLDRETDGKWVANALAAHTTTLGDDAIVIVDSVRIAKQVAHLRATFRDLVRHVHLTASHDILSARYMGRNPAVREFATYDEARENATEAEVEKLGDIADVRIDTDHLDPASIAGVVVEKFGLLPKA